MALWQSSANSSHSILPANFTMNTSTLPSTGPKLADYCFMFDSMAVKASRIVVFLIIMLSSLVGNSLVLAVTWLDMRSKDPRRTANHLISNMAVADLIITLTYMPRTMALAMRGYEWLVQGSAGLVLCKLVPSLYHLSIIVCILTLVFLSYERFSVVAWPSRIPITTRRVRLVIALIWLSGILARLPRLIALKTMEDERGILKCISTEPTNTLFASPNGSRSYDLFLKSTFYLVPLAFIVLFHSMTIFKLRRRARSKDNTSTVTIKKCREEMNKNVFKMVLSVTIAFTVCWMAYFIVKESVIETSVHCNVTFIRILLAHSNSAITPCLYAIFSKKYRRGFMLILRYVFCRLSPRQARRNSEIALRTILGENDDSNPSSPKQDRRLSREVQEAKRERNGSTRSTAKLLLL